MKTKQRMASKLCSLLATFAREWKQQPLELMGTKFNGDDFENFMRHMTAEGIVCKSGMRIVCHEMWHGFSRCIAHAKDLSEGWAMQVDYNPEQFIRCSIYLMVTEAEMVRHCHSCKRTLYPV